jgi:tetratricopeptide (TPR) repeat protein
VIDGLKQSIQSSVAVTRAPGSQAQSHLRKAQEAERGGDPLLAAKELSVALTQEPDDPELLREYERVSKVVASNLADNYEKQALYEEKTSKWGAAGRSWARVADGRPNDAVPARRSAEALLKSSGNMHEAQKYAEHAVKLDGKNVTNLTVLARVYLAAGLKLNALRELEKAAQLAPNDELVNNLLRDAR